MEEVDPAHQYNGREERSDTMKSDQESDAEGQSGSSLQNLKGSRPKKSAFQITSVEPKGNDNNHGTEDHDVDSQDELEESRVDDASSSELLDISNLSKGSMNSEIDKSLLDESNAKSTTSLPDRTGSKIVPVETVNIDETALADGASDTNGNGPSRFRVVKVPNPEPVKRGRWTCKDFPSESQQGQAGQDKLELIPSGDSSAGSSVHYVPEESATDPTTGVTKGARKRPVIRQTSSRKVSVLDTIIMNMKLPGEDDESAATAGAIDNKIAQAMDIVKGHLLLAVREEVEVLKEQITELQDANEQLREENSRLRDEKTSSQPHSQMINMGAGSTQETPYQRIQPNQSTQQPMHTSSTTYHHQSIQGQPQISSSTSTGAPPPTEHYQPLSTHHPHSQTPAQEQQQQPPYMPPAEEPGASYHAIPSQPPHGGTGTTNAAPGTEQQFQQQTQGSHRQQPPPTVTTEPHASGALNPSQYQPQHAGSGMEQQQQQHYQSAPVHHQLGASEHSQSVPPPTTALPHSQGEQQQGHL